MAEGNRVLALALMALLLTSLSAVFPPSAATLQPDLEKQGPIQNQAQIQEEQLTQAEIQRLIEQLNPEKQGPKLESKTDIAKTSLPLIENKGQLDDDVLFYANIFSGTAFVTDDSLVYSLGNGQYGVAIKEKLINSQSWSPKGLDKNKAVANYFVGDKENWRTDIPTYDRIGLGMAWPLIDVELKAHENNLEKIFKVYPGGQVNDIKLEFEGIKKLSIEQGQLLLDTDAGAIYMSKPVAYQDIDGQRKYVESSYFVNGNTYGFVVGKYDPNYILIIDPLLASTFVGGSNSEQSDAMTIDNSGNVIITGFVASADYPTVGAYDASHNGGSVDVFVSKFSPDLSTLLASTFIGGNGTDSVRTITTDGGAVFIAGQTLSSNYPTTSNAYDQTYNSGDGFITKLTNDLSTLSSSTFIGGSGTDDIYGITKDSSGNVLITGETTSSDYPTAGSPYDTVLSGPPPSSDAFVSKLSPSLVTLVDSTYVGGPSNDRGRAIALNPSGDVFITGITEGNDYPTTGGAYDTSFNGGTTDVFVSRLTPNLSSLSSSTFIGGSADTFENSKDIAIDGSNNVFIVGFTDATDYPTVGAYDSTSNGSIDVFVSKFPPSLSTLSASTYVGGTNYDGGEAIEIDGSGNVFLSGKTASSNYPTTLGAYDTTQNGADDVFVSKLSNNLSALSASTYVGGTGTDIAFAMALSAGNVFVSGRADSSDYPTAGAYDGTFNGGTQDAFVSKLTGDLLSIPIANPDSITTNQDVPITIDVLSNDTHPAGIGIRINATTNPIHGTIITAPKFYQMIGGLGNANGVFTNPHDVARDLAGNIYVADYGLHRIQKFDANGNFLYRVGGPTSGAALGQFNQPTGIAVNATGFVYVADSANNRVQVLSASGTPLFAFGSAAGPGQMSSPFGVTFDSAGNVYVPSIGGFVKKYTHYGVWLQTFGSGVGSGNGQLSTPVGIAVNSAGDVIVSEGGNHRISVFNSTGTFQFKLGSLGSANGKLNNPQHIELDSLGNIHVADFNNHRVSVFDSLGRFLYAFGSSGALEGQFSLPTGISIQGNSIIVSESGNDRLQKLSSNLQIKYTPNLYYSGLDSFTYRISDGYNYTSSFVPVNLTILPNSAPVAVADSATTPHDVPIIINILANDTDSDGTGIAINATTNPIHGTITTAPKFYRMIGSQGTVDGLFSTPNGLARDPAGNIYVVDTFNHRFQKFDANGNFLYKVGGLAAGSALGQFSTPSGIALNATGFVYVADYNNNRVQVFSSSGTPLFAFGSAAGPGQMSNPQGVAIDSAGNVYVASYGSDTVKKYTHSGVWLKTFGYGFGSGDGHLSDPFGIAVTSAGDVIVSDNTNHRITVFNSTGAFKFKFGSFGSANNQFNTPLFIELDPLDNIYVSDFSNHRISVFNNLGHFLYKLGSSSGSLEGQFSLPRGLSIQGDRIMVSDGGNNRLQDLSSNLQIKYTPSLFYSGSDSFTYKIGDANNATSAFVPVNLTILPNTAPIAVADSSTTPHDIAITIDVLANDTDSDGAGININATTNPLHGTISTVPKFYQIIGSSGTGNGQFGIPSGLTRDPAGNIYVTDVNYHRLQKFDPNGNFIYKVGGTTAGSALGQFSLPTGVAVNATGFVYVADYNNNRIVVHDSSGTPLFAFGSAAGTGQLVGPQSIAFDLSGNLYVASYSSAYIKKYTPSGTWLKTFGYGSGSGDGQLFSPFGVAVNSAGDVFVSDGNDRITVFNSTGAFKFKFGSFGGGNGQFFDPVYVELDPLGNIYVSDFGISRISVFNNLGHFLYNISGSGLPGGLFNGPRGISVQGDSIIVSDGANSRLQKLSSNLQIKYTPTAAYVGPDSFTYKIGDANNATSAFATVLLSVISPPTALDDTYTTPFETGLNNLDVLSNDSDPESDPITITAVSPSLNSGTVTINATNNGINYSPPAEFRGIDTFSYTISDGNDGTDTATVDIVILGTNGKIAFSSNREGNSEIYSVNPGGFGQTNISNNAAFDTTPAWSPNGTKIAFISDRDEPNGEIYTMNADGTGVTRITNDANADGLPAWYPNGTKLAYYKDLGGNFEIYTINSDGSGETRLTNTVSSINDIYPTVSPNGTKIAFMSDRDGNAEIYTMNTDGSEIARLTNNIDVDRDPVWSPNGAKIAFESLRDGNSEIYSMNANGTNQTRLTSNSDVDTAPSWSPNGEKITYQNNQAGNNVRIMNADGTNIDILASSLNIPDVTGSPDWGTAPLTSSAVTLDATTCSTQLGGSFSFGLCIAGSLTLEPGDVLDMPGPVELQINGLLTNYGTINTSTNIGVIGTLENKAEGTITLNDSASLLTSSGTITNHGTIDITSPTAGLTINSAATFTNYGDVNNYGTIQVNGISTFVNAGNFDNIGAASNFFHLLGFFNNTGIFTNAGLFDIYSTSYNNGTVNNLSGSTFRTNTGSFITNQINGMVTFAIGSTGSFIDGTITNDLGATITNNGDITIKFPISVTNNGDFLNAGTIIADCDVAPITVTGNAIVSLCNATLGQQICEDVLFGTWTAATNTCSTTIDSTWFFGNTLSIPAGIILNNTAILLNQGTINNDDNLVNFGTVNNDGVINNYDTIDNAGSIDNSGVIHNYNTTQNQPGGTVSVTGLLYNSLGAVVENSGAITGFDGIFQNYGIINNLLGATLQNDDNAAFHNYYEGEIYNSGDVINTNFATFNNHGVINNLLGATLENNNNSVFHNYYDGIIYNDDTIINDIGADLDNAGLVTGAVTNDGDILILCGGIGPDNASPNPAVPSCDPAAMVDLETLGGGHSTANWINDNGQIVGQSQTPAGFPHAFVREPYGVMTDLGTLPGGTTSLAHAINNDGTIVGESDGPGFLNHAFQWTSSGGMIDLGDLGGDYSSALAINNLGDIVGTSATGLEGNNHAFFWNHTTGMMTDLGTLPGRVSSVAYGINDNGKIVGESQDSGGDSTPTIWDVTALPPTVDNLPLLAEGIGSARDINNNDRVVGISNGHAVTWDATVPDPPAVDLGVYPGGFDSTAHGINNNYELDNLGRIVGEGSNASFETHALTWDDSPSPVIADLGTLGGGYSSAFDINIPGRIVGESAISSGQLRAFLLGLENLQPTSANDSYTTTLNMPLDIPMGLGVLNNDTDNDSLYAVLIEPTTNGTMHLYLNGSFTYTPDTGFEGIDSFTYKAFDGIVHSSPANVTINVINTGTIQINKVVINDDGGTKVVSDFTLKLNGTTVTSGTINTVNPGSYPIRELPDSTYNATISGDCTSNMPPNGAISWWKANGNANDSIGTNHGTLTNGATFTSGKYGQGFSLDGVDDWVEIPDNPSLTPSSMSIDIWVRPTTLAGTIISKYDSNVVNGVSWILLSNSTGNLSFGLTQTGGYMGAPTNVFRAIDTANPALTLGQWQHVTATFDVVTQEMKIYINGVEAPSTLVSGSSTITSVVDSNTPVAIGMFRAGGSVTGPTFFWNGLIDEVKIYNRALTSSEISEISQGSSFVTVNAGENKVCTITNDDIPGTIIIVKDTVPNSQADFTFTSSTLPGAPFILDDDSFAALQHIYAIGGGNGIGVVSTVEKYDPTTNTWSTVQSMPTARYTFAAATDSSGQIYAIGGSDGTTALSTVEKYDPTTNTWSTVQSMPTARRDLATAVSLSGEIYAMGGSTNGLSPFSTVEKYNPITNTWSTITSMPTAVLEPAAAVDSSGNIYVIGGYNGAAVVNTVQKYNTTTNTWSTVAPMPTARYGLDAAVSQSGDIYAIGGSTTAVYLSTVEKYNPTTNTWSTVASLPTARVDPGSAADQFGNIYAIGGTLNGGTQVSTVEKYNTATNTWSTAQSMPAARSAVAVVSNSPYITLSNSTIISELSAGIYDISETINSAYSTSASCSDGSPISAINLAIGETITCTFTNTLETIPPILTITSPSAVNTVTSTISTNTPYGIAANSPANTIYVANQASNSVSVINGATNTVTATIPVGTSPLGVAANPTTNTIYVDDAGSNSVSVINGATNTVTATIPVGTAPTGIATNPTTNTIYVTNYSSDTVSVINGATNTVTATIPLSSGYAPTGIATNPTTNLIYVVNQQAASVSVINGATNTVTTTIPVASGRPQYAAVNPTTNIIYITNYDANSVSVINGATNTVTATIPVGTNPLGIAADPSTNTIYVLNNGSNSVSVINGATNTVTATIPVGTGPLGIAANLISNTIYITNSQSNSVSVISNLVNNPIVSAAGTASDNDVVSLVTYKVDSGVVSAATGTTSWSFTTSLLSNGPHTIQVNATDTAGNVSTVYIGLNVDITPPGESRPANLISWWKAEANTLDSIGPNSGTFNNVATSLFGSATNFATGTYPTGVAVGDFNSDGRQDLITANSGSNTVSILLGTGSGSFGAATNFAVGINPSSVASSDFNSDGRQDLITANSGSNTISILLGTGTGSFGAATNFAVGPNPTIVKTDDFNSDGNQDLVVTNQNSNTISILLGTGTGSFGAATDFTVEIAPYGVITGDFNADGIQDIATANYISNTISILLGTGTGSFGAATNFAVGPNPISIHIGDFNSDGRQDLVVGNNNGANVSILLGTGTGSFGAATNFAVGIGPYGVITGDFNADGIQDIATANYDSNAVSILLGTGTGSFGAATNFAVGTHPFTITSGDFNSDGRQDLAIPNADSNNVSVLLSTVPYAMGRVSSAFSFDGIDDYISIPNSPTLDIGTGHTFSTWIQFDKMESATYTVFNKVVGSAEDKALYVDDTGRVYYYLYNIFDGTLLPTPPIIKQGNWYHLTATYNGTKAAIFVNGTLAASRTASGDVADSTGILYIGRTDHTWNTPFKGKMDQIEWYNRGLTPSEVQSLYTTTKPMIINAEAPTASSTSATLSITCNDAESGCGTMRVASDGNLDTELFETFTTTKPITLPIPDGEKTVKIQINDTAGNVSPIFTDEITLDTNVAPVANDNLYMTAINTPLNNLPVLIDDEDNNGDALSITSVGPTLNGGTATINATNNGINYVPAVGFVGIDSFNYTASDGLGGLANATVTIDIIPSIPYTVTDLDTLGGLDSTAYGINDLGHIVGESDVPSGFSHAFVWNSTLGMTDLGVLPGGTHSFAYDINNLGQIVGESAYLPSGEDHAFFWNQTHGMQDIGTLGGVFSTANAINNLGQASGAAQIDATTIHAFRWSQSSGMQDLGTIGGSFSHAFGINDLGDVVGQSCIDNINCTFDSANEANGTRHAFLWTQAGGIVDLGTLGGGNSTAFAINNAGQVVGESTTASGATHAFVWTQAGGIVDIGTLPGGTSSSADGINEAGQVVGESTTASGATHAFVWTQAGGMTDLGTFGGPVSVANAINNMGRIVGDADTIIEDIHATLWAPINNFPTANNDQYTTQQNIALSNLNVLANDSDSDFDALTIIQTNSVFDGNNPNSLNGGTIAINATLNGINYAPATGFRGVDLFNYTISDGMAIDNATIRVVVYGENGRIAFLSDRDAGNEEIYTMNSDGTTQTRITNNPASDVSPIWSPDGSKVLISSDRNGIHDIYALNSDGTSPIQLTDDAPNSSVPLAWSPDGTKILFSKVIGLNSEIFIMNSDGTNEINLTNDPAFDSFGGFSPDGLQIVFDSTRDGGQDIYVMGVDGTGIIRLTNNPSDDFNPSWSPDGTKIVFETERDGNFEIYSMNSDGSNQVNLSNYSLEDEDYPRWSPDGTKITFYSFRDGDAEIYVMNPDGTNQQRLTNNPSDDRNPDWGSAHNIIVFQSACETQLGGTWDAATSTCTVMTLILGSNDILTIPAGTIVNATTTFNATGTVEIFGTLNIVSPATFNNTGIVNVNPGSTFVIEDGAETENLGTINNYSPNTIDNYGRLNNVGIINNLAGNFINNYGTINNRAGAVINNFGTFDNKPGRIISNQGTINNEAGSTFLNSGTVNNSNLIRFVSGIFTNNAASTINIQSGGIIQNNAPITNNGIINLQCGGLPPTGPVTGNAPIQLCNFPPVATDDAATTPEDTPVDITSASLLANDSDANGNTLSVTAVSNPVGGAVSLLAGTVTFTPNLDFNGAASFDYTVSDGLLTDTGSVAVTVTAVNDSPVASAGADQSVPENTLVTLDGSATDADGGILTYLWTQTAGTLVILSDATATSPTFTAPSVLSAGETLTFQLAASDGTDTTTDSVDIIITDVNPSTLSVVSATGAQVTFSTDAGGFSSITAISETDPSLPLGRPSGVSLPYGLFDWTVTGLITGQTITVTMTFPAPIPAGSTYWKTSGVWTNVLPPILGSNDGDSILTLTIQDGGTGDLDGAANGQITDPGAVILDIAPPVITINGANPANISVGTTYVDAGATATDNIDGIIPAIVTASNVDTAIPGTYTVSYSATDVAQNTATADRTVTVVNPAVTLDTDTYVPDDGAFITVTDPSASSVTVQITSSTDQTGISKILDPVPGGLFRNTDLVVFTLDPAAATADTLLVRDGDTITASYGAATDTATIDVPGGVGAPPNPAATITFTDTQYSFESYATVRVYDTAATAPVVHFTTNPDGITGGIDVVLQADPEPFVFINPVAVMLSNHFSDNPSSTGPVLHVNAGQSVYASYNSVVASAPIITPPSEIGVPFETIAPIVCDDSEPLIPDSLCDLWEVQTQAHVGLQINQNNALFSYPPVGSALCTRLIDDPTDPSLDDDVINPRICPDTAKADIYVEIDYMEGHKPSNAALLAVVNAFKAKGVNLHLLIDEQIPHVDLMPIIPTPLGNPDRRNFFDIKFDHFGTIAERGDPAAVDIITAKRQAFHYGLWAHSVLEAPTASGWGEQLGNDFIVAAGALAGGIGSVDQQAGTFMHELGHNLDLKHGGNEDVNCKPNYPSVMSYSMQFADLAPDRTLDYSRKKYSDITEATLTEELASITGSPTRQTVIGGFANGQIIPPRQVSTNSLIDWNNNGLAPGIYPQNTHYIDIFDCRDESIRTLTSHNDWTALKYKFRDSSEFSDGRYTDPATQGEITQEVIEQIIQITGSPPPVPATPPHAPVITTSDITSEETTHVISGTTELETTVKIYDNGVFLSDATVDSTGIWSITTTLSLGTHVITATASNAGGESVQSNSVTITITTSTVMYCDKPESFYFSIVTGTDASEALIGTDGNDVLIGLGGDDTLKGREGDDCLIGGLGDDIIKGGKGMDTISGNEGNDRIHGGNDDDIISGEDGDDRLWGGKGNDNLDGNTGADRIHGQKGDDHISGGEGNDRLWGGDGDDAINAGDGNDKVGGGEGIDAIIGDLGDDKLFGGDGNDTIEGNEGADKIHGKKGDDTLNGGAGDDKIHGGHGDDYIDGGLDTDKCHGGQGDNQIFNCETNPTQMADDDDEQEDQPEDQPEYDAEDVQDENGEDEQENDEQNNEQQDQQNSESQDEQNNEQENEQQSGEPENNEQENEQNNEEQDQQNSESQDEQNNEQENEQNNEQENDQNNEEQDQQNNEQQSGEPENNEQENEQNNEQENEQQSGEPENNEQESNEQQNEQENEQNNEQQDQQNNEQENIQENNPPTASNQNFQTGEDISLNGQLVASDIDVLHFTPNTNPAIGTVSILDNGVFTYTPNQNANGQDSFGVKVSDGNSDSFFDVLIDITPVNDSPSANAGTDQTVDEGISVNLSGTATDPDAQTLTYSWTILSGPQVTLNNADTSTPSFLAPDVVSDTQITLQMSVSDGVSPVTDTVIITVKNMASSDIIPPEAYTQFDPITKNVLVFGIDDTDGDLGAITPVTSNEIKTYTIQDSAGNKLVLVVEIEKEDKEIKVDVKSLQYNDGLVINIEKAKNKFEWSTKDGAIKELDQEMEIDMGQKHKVEANYDSKKNETKITDKQGTEIKTTKPGLALLKMHTNSGSLSIEY